MNNPDVQLAAKKTTWLQSITQMMQDKKDYYFEMKSKLKESSQINIEERVRLR